MGQREIVLKSLSDLTGARTGLAGATVMAAHAADAVSIIDACRAGLDAVSSVDEWSETRKTLQDMLQKSGDLLGLAALKEEEAVEAALAEERAELITRAGLPAESVNPIWDALRAKH